MTWASQRLATLALVAAALANAAGDDAPAPDVARDLAAIARTGPNGAGSAEAREAARRLSRLGPDALPQLLVAMDTSNVVAANWCRTAFDAIVAREAEKAAPSWPLGDLKAFAVDGRRQGRARRLALDVIELSDPAFRPALIPTLVDDAEFREEAVSAVIARGDEAKKQGDTDAARADFRHAFRHARTSDQLLLASGKLKALGETASVVEQMGFVVDWSIVGPFDAPGKTGFAKTFPPETAVDLAAEYEGKDGKPVAWKRLHIDDALGQANLIVSVAAVKEAVAYAYAELHSDADRDVQVRGGADDNLTIWVNGEKVLAREQWLNGTRLDRFIAPAKLKAGTNRVLVKVCQGPQHVDPEVPNNWSFQVRFCEPDGLGVRLKPLQSE